MHRSHGLQGSLKRRYKHPSPTSINGYHTAKKLLSQSPAKRPTFAFTHESGYTLGFAQRIAHSGLHAETEGVSDGGGITTLGAFRTFTNIPGPGIRTASFAALGSWPGGALEERRKPTGQRCAYARRCPVGVAAPLGCVILFLLSKLWLVCHALRVFPRVRDMGGITTLGVLFVLLKRRTAACQSG